MITYIDGKRCWINKIIYGDNSAAAINRQSDPARRPLFGAGDSVTDVSFLQDARLRLVLNRNKAELMCRAYHDPGTWLVNPMFIRPLPRRASPYPCATTACTDSAGAQVPCVDEAGQTIQEQEDRAAP
jgi:hypothetical protein